MTAIKIILAILTGLTCQFTFAMKGGPIFDSYEWDFGNINEADGSVSHAFVLINKGKKDLLISKVVPSCSCVTVNYSHNPIKSGDIEEIEVTFSPSGSVGNTFRMVEVFDSDNNSIGTLEIKANVNPADRSIRQRYQHTITNLLYVNQVNIPFGYVYHGQQQTKTIYLANSSTEVMQIDVLNSDPHLHISCPATINPTEEIQMEITYTAPEDNDIYATYSDSVFFVVNGKRAITPIINTIICMGEVKESVHSPAIRNYPSYGQLKRKANNKYTASINIFNDGGKNLKIKAIEKPPFAIVNIDKGKCIKPGEKITLKIISSVNKIFSINLFTNDPKRPYKEISILKQHE